MCGLGVYCSRRIGTNRRWKAIFPPRSVRLARRLSQIVTKQGQRLFESRIKNCMRYIHLCHLLLNPIIPRKAPIFKKKQGVSYDLQQYLYKHGFIPIFEVGLRLYMDTPHFNHRFRNPFPRSQQRNPGWKGCNEVRRNRANGIL